MSTLYTDTISANVESEVTITSQINAGSNKIKTSSVPTDGVDLVNYTYAQTLIDRIYKKNSTAIHAITADYGVQDTDAYKWIIVDPRTGNKNVTLPTLAANQGREITVGISYLGGAVSVWPEAGELIDDQTNAQPWIMWGLNDYMKVVGTPTCWKVISCRLKYDTGWIRSDDQTNRHMGVLTVPFDAPSGTLLYGEVVTEETTGNTGIVQSVGATPLIVKSVTGNGYSTDNKKWTGATSGAYVVSNGSSHNLDNYVYPWFYKSIEKLDVRYLVSSDMTEATLISIDPQDAGGNIGLQFYPYDTTVHKLQTGSSGISYINDSGTSTVLTATDWYYKVIVSFTK